MTSLKPLLTRAQKNIKIAEDLFNLAYTTKSFQLKKKHPDWSLEQVHDKTMDLIDKGCR